MGAAPAVLAKHVGAAQAATAGAGSPNGHVVAGAYRDAKLMAIIEGGSELCWRRTLSAGRGDEEDQ